MVKRKYVTLAKITMQNSIAYRSTYLISLLGSLIFILTMFYLWQAIFESREQLSGFSWEQMKAYIFVTFLSNSLISWYSETRISRKIISGEVAMDLLKPLDFQKARIAETIGSSLLEGCIAAILIAVVLALTNGMIVPPSGPAAVLFLGSLLGSVFIKFGIVYLSSLVCFWTSNGMGVAWMRAAITNFFSGALIPLAFFPGWLEGLAKVLPFQGIVYVPASIYLGKLEGMAAMQNVGMQFVWGVILWGCGKLMWGWAVRQVTINGG
ncbi:ABC transporter permease [Paenibacillus cremeus]|uniref:Antibiotic transporter permease n=1 Tax=Paenibacillus cremeus TaxID=2163881 RepID=A0A559JKC2_9BACL|nr:ABC-2 family transporter protein [Paenibacillus cremeus]TVY00337.1 antibiotic transporter permease [Paenibacillus cremeus]